MINIYEKESSKSNDKKSGIKLPGPFYKSSTLKFKNINTRSMKKANDFSVLYQSAGDPNPSEDFVTKLNSKKKRNFTKEGKRDLNYQLNSSKTKEARDQEDVCVESYKTEKSFKGKK